MTSLQIIIKMTHHHLSLKILETEDSFIIDNTNHDDSRNNDTNNEGRRIN